MVKESHIIDLKTVCECNQCMGCKTWHPQVSLVNLENSSWEERIVKFEFYTILLIESASEQSAGLGHTEYDYSNATMIFLSPGEVFRLSESENSPTKGYLLAFHPDLLKCTPLQNQLYQYSFFNYRKEEALHLSARETEKILCCFENMEDELHHSVDTHTATLLSGHIKLLLDYCTRYYERQFITREDIHKKLLERVKKTIDNYIRSGQLKKGMFPSVESIADTLGLSASYFTDLLQFETGYTPEEFFQLQRIQAARRMLLCSEYTTAEVSHWLGYPSVQYFSLLFKKLTGFAPCEYCHSQN